MHIKPGDKIKIKTYDEVIKMHGHSNFQGKSFFKKYGNKMFTVVRLEPNRFKDGYALIINEKEHDIIDKERRLYTHAVKKISGFYKLSKELFEL